MRVKSSISLRIYGLQTVVSPQLSSPFLHSLQTFRLNTARVARPRKDATVLQSKEFRVYRPIWEIYSTELFFCRVKSAIKESTQNCVKDIRVSYKNVELVYVIILRAVKNNCAHKLVFLVDQRFHWNLGLGGCGLVIGRRLDFQNVSRWSFAFLAAVHQTGDDQRKHQDGADDNGSFDAGGLAFEPGSKPWKTKLTDNVKI